jgi:PleD family two-component response regulator
VINKTDTSEMGRITCSCAIRARTARMPELPAQLARPLILLVEDEHAIRKVMEILFEDEGYQVVLAQNGREGLAILADLVPDLIITDYMMPELDGVGLLRAVRRDCRVRDVPVLLMSSVPVANLPGHEMADQTFLKGGQLISLLNIVATLVESAPFE